MANDLENGGDLHSSECNGCIPATKIKAPISWTTNRQEAVCVVLSGDDAPKRAPVSEFPKGFDWASI